jgi:hypothetical protein
LEDLLWKIVSWKEEENSEAQNPEVNLGHPNLEDTWSQISHFGDSTLQRIVRVMH